MKLNTLFCENFECYYLQRTDVELGKMYKKLNYSVEDFSDDELVRLLKFRQVVLKLTKQNFGTLVITLNAMNSVFDYLQKKYKEDRSFYFWGTNTFANFKILEAGKIQRKIASRGWFNNHTTSSEEQVLGKTPCEYETQHNHIYKIKSDEFLKFSKETLLDIFDFYVKINREESIDFDSFEIFYNIDTLNVDWGMQYFSKPEFTQSLIHLRKSYTVEFTVPIVIFEDTECLRFRNLKNKCKINEIKSARNLLKLNIFNIHKKTYIKSNEFFRLFLMNHGEFLSTLADVIIEATKLKEDERVDPLRQLICSGEGEFIPSKTSLIYFAVRFDEGKTAVDFYSLMKSGKEEQKKFICTANSFEKEELMLVYNQLLDYILEQNICEKMNNK